MSSILPIIYLAGIPVAFVLLAKYRRFTEGSLSTDNSAGNGFAPAACAMMWPVLVAGVFAVWSLDAAWNWLTSNFEE